MSQTNEDEMSPLPRDFHVTPLTPLPNFPPAAGADPAIPMATMDTTDQHTMSGLSSFINKNISFHVSTQESISYDTNVAKVKYFAGKIKFKNE